MKKILYILFIGLLLMMPFGVFAEGEGEGTTTTTPSPLKPICYGSSLYTEGDSEGNPDKIECALTYEGSDLDGVTLAVTTNDTAALNINAKADATISEGQKFQEFVITLKDSLSFDGNSKTVSVVALAKNGDTVLASSESYKIDIYKGVAPDDYEEDEDEDTVAPSEKKSTIPTSGTANPDTADINVVGLATLSIIFLAVVLLSFKKVVNNN